MAYDEIVEEIRQARDENELRAVFNRYAGALTDILLDLGGQIEAKKMDYLQRQVFMQ